MKFEIAGEGKDDEDRIFAGGDGTADNPYLVATAGEKGW